MAESEDVWLYNPSFALAVFATVIYGLIFIAISYLTLIKYRAKYFIVVVVGATVEVAGYILRVYSIKNKSQLVCPLCTIPFIRVNSWQVPFVLTLTFVVLAPIFIAAGNYLLISRLILAVLPPSNHRILKIPGRKLTRIFVAFDIVAFLIQGNGSGIQSSNDWEGKTELIGRYVVIAGLAFQLIAFGLFLCVFRKFHVLANRMAVQDAPEGWRKVVRAVYISSGLIVVSMTARLK